MENAAVNSPKKQSLRSVLRECAAVFFWLWLVVDVFVYDLRSLNPWQGWPLDSPWLPWYEFLLLGSLFLLSLKLFGTKRVLVFLVFILSYPLIWMFWRVPKLILKHPEAALPFVPFAIHWLKHFRFRVATIFLALCGATAVLSNAGATWQIGGMICLCTYLAIHYVMQVQKTINVTRYLPKLGESVMASWENSVVATARKEYDALKLLDPNSEPFNKKRRECPEFCVSDRFTLFRSFPRT
jgi:hypothetical protein